MSDQKSQNPSVTVGIQLLVPLFLWTVALVLVLRFFDAFRLIALGFLGTAIVAAALRPFRRVLPGPRWWSAILSALIPALFLLGLIVLLSWMLSEPVRRELAEWPRIHQALNDQLGYWSQRLGLGKQLTVHEVLAQLSRLVGQDLLTTTTTALTNLLLAGVFIFFGSVYLLTARREQLISPLMPLLANERQSQMHESLDELSPRLRWWLLGSLIAMAVTGAATYLGFRLIGLQFAAGLAVLAGVAELVPTFGPLFAFLLALLFAAADGRSAVMGIVGVYFVIQTLESYILQPYVMKKAVDMPPVVTLFTIILWSHVFGVAGLVLAIPINLVIWTFVDHFAIRPRRRRQACAAQADAE